MRDQQYLNDYKNRGFDNVEGWCSKFLFEIVGMLDDAEINKEGGCLEIGVHHGKFYILLNSVIERRFDSYAVDVFEKQSLNIDGSGRGSLQLFKDNLIKYDRHGGANTNIVAADSTDVKSKKLFDDRAGYFRFVSIDGGHTTEHTISDLQFACGLASNEGVVILDDVLNYHWLGVIEGCMIYLSQKPALVPFAIGHNKLFLAKISYRSFYRDLFGASTLRSKLVDFMGHSIVAL
jgi:hypothetical protein